MSLGEKVIFINLDKTIEKSFKKLENLEKQSTKIIEYEDENFYFYFKTEIENFNKSNL